MPRIVRFGRLKLSDDVVKIRDAAPASAAKKKLGPPTEDEFKAISFKDGEAPGQAEAGHARGPGDDFEEEEFAPGAFDGEDEAPKPKARDAGQQAARGEIISAAMAEAGRIIEDAVHQAQAEKDAVLATVRAEADELKAQAADEGRREGIASAIGEMKQITGDVERAVATFEGERAGFEAEYEEQLRWLAMEIASKVLAKKVSENDAEMTEMVQKAVQNVRGEPWVRVEVSQEMTHLIDRLTQLYDGSAGVEVSGIPAAAGTVHIETPSGVVDASLRTQLENLREYFARPQ